MNVLCPIAIKHCRTWLFIINCTRQGQHIVNSLLELPENLHKYVKLKQSKQTTNNNNNKKPWPVWKWLQNPERFWLLARIYCMGNLRFPHQLFFLAFPGVSDCRTVIMSLHRAHDKLVRGSYLNPNNFPLHLPSSVLDPCLLFPHFPSPSYFSTSPTPKHSP